MASLLACNVCNYTVAGDTCYFLFDFTSEAPGTEWSFSKRCIDEWMGEQMSMNGEWADPGQFLDSSVSHCILKSLGV